MKNINNYIQEKLNISTVYTYKPQDSDELRMIIEERLKKDKDAELNDIDVSDIKSMAWLFVGLDPHNININEWNVSNVEDMSNIFYKCENFNCDLSDWDVSNVKYMHYMFFGCENFNCDLSDWDVSNVKDMSYMFNQCRLLKNKPDWYNEKNN